MLQLRDALRNETRDAHDIVDAAFGALNLADRDDYRRFLAAHFMATAPLQPILGQFCEQQLGRPAPDFLGQLRSDLVALDIDANGLPALDQPGDLDPRAVAYVMAGSRLGLSMLRRQPYWGKGDENSSSYMEDGEGIMLWRALLDWFAGQQADQAEVETVCAAARRCFVVFETAFAMSGSAKG